MQIKIFDAHFFGYKKCYKHIGHSEWWDTCHIKYGVEYPQMVADMKVIEELLGLFDYTETGYSFSRLTHDIYCSYLHVTPLNSNSGY